MGAAELNESEFSSEGLPVTLERTTDGKSKATVTPDGMPPSFFLRVRMKWRNQLAPQFANCGAVLSSTLCSMPSRGLRRSCG